MKRTMMRSGVITAVALAFTLTIAGCSGSESAPNDADQIETSSATHSPNTEAEGAQDPSADEGMGVPLDGPTETSDELLPIPEAADPIELELTEDVTEDTDVLESDDIVTSEATCTVLFGESCAFSVDPRYVDSPFTVSVSRGSNPKGRFSLYVNNNTQFTLHLEMKVQALNPAGAVVDEYNIEANSAYKSEIGDQSGFGTNFNFPTENGDDITVRVILGSWFPTFDFTPAA